MSGTDNPQIPWAQIERAITDVAGITTDLTPDSVSIPFVLENGKEVRVSVRLVEGEER